MSSWELILTVTSALMTLLLRGAYSYSYIPQYQGSVERCQQSNRGWNGNFNTKLLPGMGWDALRNVETRRILDFSNYYSCLGSTDGQFLIPDGTKVTLQERTFLNRVSSVLSSFTRYEPTTASTISKGEDMTLQDVVANGYFSEEFLNLKRKQIEENVFTLRSQLRDIKYKASLNRDLEYQSLTSEFKNMVTDLDIAFLSHRGYPAILEAGQKLVEKFGTHVVTEVHVGAGLQKKILLKHPSSNQNPYALMNASEKIQFITDANEAMYDAWSIGRLNSFREFEWKYRTIVTEDPIIQTADGQAVPTDTTPEEWLQENLPNMTVMDRAGIRMDSFLGTWFSGDVLQQSVRIAIENYYEMNTIHGCTDITAPTFRAAANYDDGSCNANPVNHAFGGMYQTCKLNIGGDYTKPWHEAEANASCDSLILVNPLTQNHSCPDGYETQELFGERRRITKTKDFLKWVYGESKTFRVEYSSFYRTIRFYNCFNPYKRDLSEKPQFLFGGLYSIRKNVSNVLTSNKNCPEGFTSYPYVLDFFICLTQNRTLTNGVNYLGGFFSCQIGNPTVAIPWTPWLKRCPEGYSRQPFTIMDIAGTLQNCMYFYCLRGRQFSKRDLGTLKMLPFQKGPSLHEHSRSEEENEGSTRGFNTPNMIAAGVLGMLGTLAAVAVFIGTGTVRKHLKEHSWRQTSSNNSSLDDILAPEASLPEYVYGSTITKGDSVNLHNLLRSFGSSRKDPPVPNPSDVTERTNRYDENIPDIELDVAEFREVPVHI